MLFATASKLIVTVFPDRIIMSSAEDGIPTGDQFAAVFQSPLEGPLYVLVAPKPSV